VRSFQYVALTTTGEKVTGVHEARSAAELDRLLESKGLLLKSAHLGKEDPRMRGSSKLGTDDLIAFTSQLSTLIGAGIPIVEALESVKKRLEHTKGAATIQKMIASLRGGSSLSQAMAQHPRTFPDVYRSSVLAGEASGALDRILERQAEHLEWVRGVRSTTFQALIYPACLFVGVLGLILLLLLFVLPRITGMFAGGVDDLPAQTRFLIQASEFLRENFLFLGAGVGAAAFAISSAARTEKGRIVLDGLLLRIPKLGRLLKLIGTSKFSRTASILHEAGCNVFTMLEVSGKASGRPSMKRDVDDVILRVRRGSSMSEALAVQPTSDPFLVQMVAVGEKSGRMGHCLEHFGKQLDEEVRREVKRFLSFLEPALLFGAGVVVAFILLATILPIFKMYDSLM